MMDQYDAIVIGGGILGCFMARSLRQWNISVLLLEQEEDVCTGITRANSAIVYPGYDNKPGTRKAELTVRSNREFDALCEMLDVPFSRCGSLLVTYEPDTVPRLERKMENGLRNGVPGLRLLTGSEAEAMEPMLHKGVVAALYAPTTGTVNPWQLGIAAYENALRNGAASRMDTRVTGIRTEDGGYVVDTTRGQYRCRAVVNCAGLEADRVQELLCPPRVRLELDGAEYLVLDPDSPKPDKVIFHQSRSCGKGITAIPCTEGNLLLSGVRKELGVPFATTVEGIEELKTMALELLPGLETLSVIRSFGAVRPNPRTDDGDSIPDFCIENPVPGFYSFIGIKTPGLTCAHQLSLEVAGELAVYLNAETNPGFDPHRKGIPQSGNEIVCRCGQITSDQIREAISRGATTVDGVKRRIGTGMGPCQGSRCSWEIEKMLEDAKHGNL